ncbi:hypothetical protein BC629DRAFT_1444463 [Irpex lacteus]|nr:hypothetical protein BC629DRAFT_1444463 [Irpex lacteus]
MPKLLLALAPEIVCAIVILLRDVDPPSIGSIGRRDSDGSGRSVHHQSISFRGFEETAPPRHPLGWLKITHICRYLRYAALGFPALWTNINCSAGCRLWLPEWLNRSKDLPLTVSVSFHPSYRASPSQADSDASSLVFHDTFTPIFSDAFEADINTLNHVFLDPRHLNRIQHLKILHAHTVLSFVNHVITHSAPQLETVSIVNQEETHLPPILLFIGQAPHLHTIVWDGPFLAWQSFMFPNITNLNISLPSIHNPLGDRALDALFNLLQSLPHLVSFELTRLHPPIHQRGVIRRGTRLLLPKLSCLCITESSLCFVQHLLEGLDIPQLERLQLDLITSHPATGYDYITRYISEYVRRSPSPIHSLEVYVDDTEWQIVARTRSPISTLHMEGLSSTGGLKSQDSDFLTLTLTYINQEIALPTDDTWMATVLATLSLTEVETLCLHEDPSTQARANVSTHWCTWIYKQCSAATHVTAINAPVAPLLVLLADSNPFGVKSFCGRMGVVEEPLQVLPALRTLWIGVQDLKVETQVLRSFTDMHSGFDSSGDLIHVIQKCLLSWAGNQPTTGSSSLNGRHDNDTGHSDSSLKVPLSLLHVQLSRHRYRGHDDFGGSCSYGRQHQNLLALPSYERMLQYSALMNELYIRMKEKQLRVAVHGEICIRLV